MSEEKELRVKWCRVIEEFHTPYMNFIDLGNYTMFRLIAFKTVVPRHGFYVGIERLGNFYFGTHRGYHWEYVKEKLSLQEPDARAIADWMNAQMDFPESAMKELSRFGQQGHYSKRIIEDVEIYGLGNEMKFMPWKPEILE